MEWAKQNATKNLIVINIASTLEPTTHEYMLNNVAQDQPRYCVDMPIISTIINLESISLIENLVETLEWSSIDVGVECRILEIQEALVGNNFNCHYHISVQEGPMEDNCLVDFSQSHVVISKEYLTIMRQKAMDKAILKHIREARRKEKQDKQAKKATITMTISKRTAKKELKTTSSYLHHSLIIYSNQRNMMK